MFTILLYLLQCHVWCLSFMWINLKCLTVMKFPYILEVSYHLFGLLSVKGVVGIFEKICPRSDPAIAHMLYYLDPVKLI